MTKRDKYLRTKYGLTEAIFLHMERLHNGCCWICARPPKRRLNVDHNHKTGQVRGLLCFRCNKFLVGRHRTGTLLRAAANYLDSIIDWRRIVLPSETQSIPVKDQATAHPAPAPRLRRRRSH